MSKGDKQKEMKNRLTPKQEKFIEQYLEIGNASDAYRSAYKTDNMSDKTVWEAASRLLDNSKVSARLDEIRAKAAHKLDITVEYLVQQMHDACEMAANQGNAAAYGQNLERLSKLTGNWVDKQEVKHDTGPEQWLTEYLEDYESRQDNGTTH
ncbi:MAG: terminase small subunit [Candidatus Dadabacteria bacterium]|nr:terminase small subunit [Candidatus Dadabacteria bacterium]